MTIAERNDKLKHFIACLKCEMSGKCCDDDNCSTQYAAGNMGEIIENLEAISKVLEQESKIKVLERDEIIRKLGAVYVYQASAWITLLDDLEYLKLKICEVEE